jgi:hypothetical protein
MRTGEKSGAERQHQGNQELRQKSRPHAEEWN